MCFDLMNNLFYLDIFIFFKNFLIVLLKIFGEFLVNKWFCLFIKINLLLGMVLVIVCEWESVIKFWLLVIIRVG